MSKKKFPLGAYAMAYTSTTKNMKSRSVPAIAFAESNEIGGDYFMSLYIGKNFHSYD